MMVQILTARETAIAALKAYDEGRLGFQHGHTECRYRYMDGAVCAVGAALTDESLGELCRSRLILSSSVACRDVFRGKTPADSAQIRALQNRHDNACMNEGGSFVADFLNYARKIAALPATQQEPPHAE